MKRQQRKALERRLAKARTTAQRLRRTLDTIATHCPHDEPWDVAIGQASVLIGQSLLSLAAAAPDLRRGTRLLPFAADKPGDAAAAANSAATKAELEKAIVPLSDQTKAKVLVRSSNDDDSDGSLLWPEIETSHAVVGRIKAAAAETK